jgi:FAD/FMN-containing dehydrogenase
MEYLPLVFSERDLAFQRSLLDCFNPEHRLNPGKVFGGRIFKGKNLTTENTEKPFVGTVLEPSLQMEPSSSSNVLKTNSNNSELFTPFYDPDNSTICVDASIAPKALHEQTQGDRLYFPLYLSDDMPLGYQIYMQPYTSRSFRYGTFGDNVLGMNIKVNGKTVRVGGRTIKNAAGFDLVRFLCASGRHFGCLEKLVLRLRPAPPKKSIWKLQGDESSLEAFQKKFLISGWSLAVDLFDFELDSDGLKIFLEFSCSLNQEQPVEDYIRSVSKELGLEAQAITHLPQREFTSCARVKTLLSRTLSESRDLIHNFGGRAYGYLGNGFFMYQPESAPRSRSGMLGYLQELHDHLSPLGGQVAYPGVKSAKNEHELIWERILKEKWDSLP